VLARWPGFERQTGEVVLQAAQELSALKSKGLSQDYYGTMFKVCCGELNDAKRDAFLHGASLGKREIKSIQALLGEKVCAATCEDASDEALVLAILRVPSGDERETMLAEVKRRSLVQA